MVEKQPKTPIPKNSPKGKRDQWPTKVNFIRTIGVPSVRMKTGDT